MATASVAAAPGGRVSWALTPGGGAGIISDG
jgi:hypothetical protein